jgi:predicted signal transduction protein with EAL and GGDEF domain
MNIDGFSRVNDQLGHGGADRLLALLGRRLRTIVPEARIARLDGDEFGLVLWAAGGDRLDPRAIGETLLAAVRADAIIDNRLWRLDGRIGLVTAPSVASSAAELHSFADAAVLAAKKGLAGAIVVFDDSLRMAIDSRRRREVDMREALGADAFEPWLQPIVDVRGERIHSLEVLARWRVGDEILTPGAFLPLAEELGLMRELDRQIMTRAFAATRDWLASGVIGSLSINVSPRDLDDADVVADLLVTLARSGLPPSRLVIELTETALFEDFDRARELLETLSKSGSRVALDDFGTGYSNLRALARLPIDYIKIDRSLVSEIETDPRVLALCAASIALARALDMGVVAEGVETPTQAHLLRALGCQRMQGYLFSPALSAEALGRKLHAYGASSELAPRARSA